MSIKIKQADLIREIVAQDRKDSRKKFFNVNALRLMLDAAKDVKDSESFAQAFTPTRENNAIARKLKLGLDVQRGRWVLKGEDKPELNRLTRESNMTDMNEAIDGKKLIELLMQALEEGDNIRFTEYVNQMLSQKVSECLQDQRKLIAEQLFVEGRTQDKVFATNRRALKSLVRQLETAKSPTIERQIQARIEALKKRLGIKEDIADLVKTSNLNRDDDSDFPQPEDEQLPNVELAPGEVADDQTFDEGSELAGLDTFRG